MHLPTYSYTIWYKQNAISLENNRIKKPNEKLFKMKFPTNQTHINFKLRKREWFLNRFFFFCFLHVFKQQQKKLIYVLNIKILTIKKPKNKKFYNKNGQFLQKFIAKRNFNY